MRCTPCSLPLATTCAVVTAGDGPSGADGPFIAPRFGSAVGHLLRQFVIDYDNSLLGVFPLVKLGCVR